MDHGLHFISGLPRAGSTLLSALLTQNPALSAGMTSPLCGLFDAMLRQTSQRIETSVFVDDAMRRRLLAGVFELAYADVHPTRTVFDTNRGWTARLPALARLFPHAKVICCVRNPAWIVDSIECLIRRNAFELSGIFGFEPGGTVYSRAEGLTGGTGMVGYAMNALRDALFGPDADRLLLVRYDSLTRNPLGTLAAIYQFCDLPPFAHDPERVEPSPAMAEFDRRMGTPGLHHVAAAVRPNVRETILPPDVFARHEAAMFWRDLANLPSGVRIV